MYVSPRSGKSTVGTGLAQKFGIPYVDGDTLHSEKNIAKMANGIPLQDEDRVPWVSPLGLQRSRAQQGPADQPC